MSQIFKPLDNKIYLDWIETIKTEASDELSSWETSFVESIESQLRSGRLMSEKQHEILERIYAEKTP